MQRVDDKEKQEAEKRAKKEHQETMDRIAKANAIRVALGRLAYSFERINDLAEIERLKAAAAAGPGGGISDSSSIVTNMDDKDGIFKAKIKVIDKDGGEIYKEIPGVLIHVERGVISCSVPAYLFEQQHADMMIAKALENGKDLILRPGGIAGYDQNGNPREPEWEKLGKGACKRALKNLDMMIKAANKLGQPYELSPGAISLLDVLDKEKLKGMVRPNLDKSKNRVETYTKAQVEASKSGAARNLIVGATRDGNLNKHKDIIEKQPEITDVTTFKTDVGKLGSDEQLGAVAKRLEEIEKRAEVAEAAAKEVEASIDGAGKLLDALKTRGAELFANAGLVDVISKMQEKAEGKHKKGSLYRADQIRAEATELGIENLEKHQLHRAEAVLENLKERFDSKLAAVSPRAELQAKVDKEIKAFKEQAKACRELVDGLAKAALDPDMQKRIAELQKKADAMDKRAEAMSKAQTEVDKKAKDIPAKVKDAQDVLVKDQDRFEQAVGRRPTSRPSQ